MYVHRSPKCYRNKEWLYQKYITEELTLKEIGEIANCSDVCIGNWLKVFGIKARKRKEISSRTRIKIGCAHENHKNNCTCFICKRKRGEEIIHKNNCVCLKCRIQRGELKGKNNPMYGKGLNGDKNGMFGKIISDEIKESLRKHHSGEGNPMYGMSKEKAPNWRGGISTLPWGKEFTKELKDKIRSRDNYICQICEDKEAKRRHAVHHIDYDKENNSPENLITLCIACHCRTGYKRKHWRNFFKELVHA